MAVTCQASGRGIQEGHKGHGPDDPQLIGPGSGASCYVGHQACPAALRGWDPGFGEPLWCFCTLGIGEDCNSPFMGEETEAH